MKAFPQKYPKDALSPCSQSNPVETGMDLRDYFAAKAMQAYVTELMHKEADYVCGAVAEMAYFMADAMMEARNESI